MVFVYLVGKVEHGMVKVAKLTVLQGNTQIRMENVSVLLPFTGMGIDVSLVMEEKFGIKKIWNVVVPIL